MNRTLALLLIAWLLLGGCSGSSGTSIAEALSKGTASFVVLDLTTRDITYQADIPDANSDVYRQGKMIFRRVPTASGDIFIAKYEVTQAQWQTIAGAGGSTSAVLQPWTLIDDDTVRAETAHGGKQPAFNLSHQLVTTVLSDFTLDDGATLDLPTAAEWTSACGVAAGWWWGATATYDEVGLAAVVRESVLSTARLTAGGGMDTGGPLVVGSRTANRFGLYDILGNVWEWTREGDQLRGGSWFDSVQTCRAEIVADAGKGITSSTDYALFGARLVLRP